MKSIAIISFAFLLSLFFLPTSIFAVPTLPEPNIKVPKLPWDSGISDPLGPRAGHSATIYKNKMYIFGGYTVRTGYLNTMRIYDFSKKEWSDGTPDIVGGGRDSHSAVIYKDKLYIYGGSVNDGMKISSNDVRIYDFKTNTWNTGASNPNDPYGRFGHSAVVYKDKMYVYGTGTSGTVETTTDIQIYDFSTNVWSRGASSPESLGRRVHQSAVMYGDIMYIFGGNPINGTENGTNTLLLYHLENDTWTEGVADTAGGSRSGHSAVIYKDKMYVFGGNINSQPYLTNTVSVYDLKNKTWTEGESDKVGRSRTNHSAVVYNDNIYIFGGETSYYERIFSNAMRIYSL
jgi:N-acetylneuraminic acid mutarotase